MDVGGGDDLVDLIPGGAHEAAEAAPRAIAFGLFRVADDGGPGLDRRQGRPGFAPQTQQVLAHQGVFEPIAAVEIPGIAGTTRTTPRFVVRHVGASAGIVGLLGLPGDDAALDINLPAARAGTVYAVGGTNDLVVLPALPVAIFPGAVLSGDDAMAVRKLANVLAKEHQSIEKMAHC